MSKQGGLAFIEQRQQPDGGFFAYNVYDPSKQFRTTFVPSLIALALHDVPGAKAVRSRIADFLLTQKSVDWSWNYWDRNSEHAKKNPYPDDLDDTFLAAAHLWHEDRTLFTPEVMAKLVRLLFVTETEPGGPYVTWVADETADKAWRDVDVIVNANIAGFLALQDVSLPLVNALIERAVEKNQLVSPYYPGLLPGAYLLARWYKGNKRTILRERILAQQKNGTWEGPHETALAISALLRLGYPAAKLTVAIAYLKEQQRSTGEWEFGPMYIVDVTYGAPALTAALCLEAFSLYEQALKNRIAPLTTNTKDALYEKVVASARAAIEKVPQPSLRTRTTEALERILSRDVDRQIILLPRLVEKTARTKIAPETMIGLGEVSLWGWISYTGFDDFLDLEGDPRGLPSAIFAHRQMTMATSLSLKEIAPFHDEVTDILNRLDGANAWEVSHCRGEIRGNRLVIDSLPDYGDLWQLADRSLGHVIAGIGVLYEAGYASTSPEMIGLRDFFRHYLIARQLNDDAHDWQDDLLRGHVNAVAVLILKEWLARGRARNLQKGIDLKRQTDALRLIMWERAVGEVCRVIDLHIEAARTALISIEAFAPQPLLALLNPLEEASRSALRSRDEALEFISQL